MPIDPKEIDLLVDGELPDDRRRRLLLSFEQSPDGWRACALAFLEAQCWRDQLRGMADTVRATSHAGPSRPSVAALPSAPRPARRLGGAILAMAASFLVTMIGVGLLRLQWRSADVTPREIVRKTLPSEEGGKAHPLQPLGAPQLAADKPALPGISPSLEAEGQTPLLSVRMPGGDAQTERELLLPVVEAPHFNDSLLTPSIPSGVDPRLEAFVRQHGMEIQRQRHMMPLHTDEGRDIVVPVSRYEIRRRDAADIQ